MRESERVKGGHTRSARSFAQSLTRQLPYRNLLALVQPSQRRRNDGGQIGSHSLRVDSPLCQRSQAVVDSPRRRLYRQEVQRSSQRQSRGPTVELRQVEDCKTGVFSAGQSNSRSAWRKGARLTVQRLFLRDESHGSRSFWPARGVPRDDALNRVSLLAVA